jgi:hypothetical protein
MSWVLSIIEPFLREGLMIAGDPPDEDVIPLGTAAEETLARIRDEWEALGRDPDIMEIAWFEPTPKGVEFAQRLSDHVLAHGAQTRALTLDVLVFGRGGTHQPGRGLDIGRAHPGWSDPTSASVQVRRWGPTPGHPTPNPRDGERSGGPSRGEGTAGLRSGRPGPRS